MNKSKSISLLLALLMGATVIMAGCGGGDEGPDTAVPVADKADPDGPKPAALQSAGGNTADGAAKKVETE
jgi:hypothetical protein